MDCFFGPRENWPEEIKKILESDLDEQNNDLLTQCFAGMMSYLTDMLIIDNVLSTARYQLYDPKTFAISRMVLDS